MPRKPINPGAALARLRWAKPDADRGQPRQAGKLGGRPKSPDRCPCGAMTRKRAEARGHVCKVLGREA